MQRAAWHVSLTPLLATPDARGSDRLLPGVAGVIPYRRRSTVTRYSLPFIVIGTYDRLGNMNADPEAGLDANIAWLNANLLLPTGAGDGTRVAVFTPRGLAAITADVHVLGIPEPYELGPVMRTTLEISAPRANLHL